jgi:hypothetical protein
VSDSAAECTSGQYRNIHQLAEKLASPNKKSPVDTLDREEKVEEKQRQKRIETSCRDKNELPPPALRTISRAMKERRAAK